MISTKEFVEFNAELIKFITSTLENATVLQDSSLSKVPALNVLRTLSMMNTSKNAEQTFAQQLMNTTVQSLVFAFVKLDTSELEEYVQTVHLDFTMTVTLIAAFANLDSNSPTASVNPFALQTKHSSMENAIALKVN